MYKFLRSLAFRCQGLKTFHMAAKVMDVILKSEANQFKEIQISLDRSIITGTKMEMLFPNDFYSNNLCNETINF